MRRAARHFRSRSYIVAICLITLWTASLREAAFASERKSDSLAAAERLVDQAAQAAREGNAGRKFALLRQAAAIAPEFELARWQLGQIKLNGEWVAIEVAQRREAANPAQSIYRELRAQQPETLESQLALARWCRKNDLEDEARVHWASVVSLAPRHREALRALGMRWSGDQLLSRDQIALTKSEQFEARQASRHWHTQVAKWRRSLTKGRSETHTSTLDEIRTVDDPDSIQAIEAVTLGDTASQLDPKDWRAGLSLAFISALDGMKDHAATESLVHYAVLSPFASVRDSATERLRYRSQHDFIPLLLDELTMPVQSSFRVDTDADGNVHYMHTLYREGAEADWSRQTMRTARQSTSPQRIAARLVSDMDPTTLAQDAPAAANAAVGARQASNRFAREAAAAEAEVAAMNRGAVAINARVTAVLANMTEQDFGDNPREWWNWWAEQNDYDQSEERPVYETSDVTYEIIPPPPPPCECFARGTPVWTKTGQRPIESLELGELVLAQDVETGELAYKPVTRRTVRPPSLLLKLSISGETLLTTRGHPFWVDGVGWRMAKELGEGAALASVTGSTRVESAEQAIEAEAYNLVVADFNTYFVGESGILVHDNTRRRPSRAKVPGVISD